MLRSAIFCLALSLAAADQPATVDSLIATVRAGLANHRRDRDLARQVHQAMLTQSLDDAVIEQLEAEGAGRQTVDELNRHQALAIGMPPPAHALRLFDPPPDPSPAEQSQAIESARQLALAYSNGLPNFLCTEIIHRFFDDKRTENWKAVDTLTVAVRYSTHDSEDYQLTAINGHATRRALEDVGGSTSEGEFGSALQEVFLASSAAQFHWERWANLRGRLVEVYSYRIDKAHSKYNMTFDFDGMRYALTPAVRGAVYLERGTHRVLRLRMEADRLPPDFPVLRSPGVIDYDETDIAGQKFLLPSRAEARIVTRKDQNRNVMEFGDYRKFASDASITFGKP